MFRATTQLDDTVRRALAAAGAARLEIVYSGGWDEEYLSDLRCRDEHGNTVRIAGELYERAEVAARHAIVGIWGPAWGYIQGTRNGVIVVDLATGWGFDDSKVDAPDYRDDEEEEF